MMPPNLEPCDDELGGGRNKDRNFQECFSGAERFLTESTANLEEQFACIAEVGTAGDGNEQIMQAMRNAVSAPLTTTCNAGFLRDDAILVVTFITDENDSNGDSAGTPAGWKQALVSAKNGDENAIVVLGCRHRPDGALLRWLHQLRPRG